MFRLYRRLDGSFGEPVYRPVEPGQPMPPMCEVDEDEVVEVHCTDEVASLPVARVTRVQGRVRVDAHPFEEVAFYELSVFGAQSVLFDWGKVTLIDDRVTVTVDPHIL